MECNIRPIVRCGILRQLIECGAIPAKAGVRDTLLAYQGNVTSESFKRGRLLISTSGNGQSASHQMSTPGFEFGPVEVQALSEQLIRIFEDAVANDSTLSDDGDQTHSRAILTAMLSDDRMQSINRRGMDSTLLGFPQTGNLTAGY